MRIAFKLLFIAFGLGLIAYMFSLDDQAQEELREELPVLGDGVLPDESDDAEDLGDEGADKDTNEEEDGPVDEGNGMEDTDEPEEQVSSSEEGANEESEAGDTLDLQGGYHTYIGMDADELTEQMGDPDRRDPTQYGYEWYVWNDEEYLQAGVAGGEVVTVYTNAVSGQAEPFTIGESYSTYRDDWSFQQEVSLSGDYSTFQFNLSEADLETRPLVEMDGVYIQLYFDTFEGSLSSIRYSDAETIVLHQPYALTYSRSMPDKPDLTDEEWEQVEEGMARQVFDLTNNFRSRHGLEALDWDEDTARVAFYHSKDMYENEYFSHSSPNHGELSDRLTAEGVQYHMAAENIAARYDDAAAAVEGWLNSEGHRVNLKHEDLTHLGVGVYREFYTQNFITPW
ncbi:hypothetical protein CR205_04690 [Alteribacter lacisalsi]|jgi:uncharacterized protein YkwD|uniref:SCP domain-containing protein n=1 Tax=Alteribacter lacisalsi TaxID=2045244 RepID=A0A2W0HAR3_9BACI|nr:CAP domain-containing protein [Alteribacter lacisalsi]PYZ97896.1 hypothetical protein CR205_04690 [Alteribacter lacisalsi]